MIHSEATRPKGRPRKNVPTLRVRHGRNRGRGPIGETRTATPPKPRPSTTDASMAMASRRVRWRPKNPGAALAARSLARRCSRRRQIFPVEIVRDDLRFLANDALGAAVAPFGEQPAELVDHLVGVEPDALGVVAHIAAREDALGPARQVAVFQRLPELDAELGLGGQLLEGDALCVRGLPGGPGRRFLSRVARPSEKQNRFQRNCGQKSARFWTRNDR